MEAKEYIDKRLNESVLAYHGTNKRFKSFNPNAVPINDTGYMGVGSYFNQEYRHAKQYALMTIDIGGGTPIVYTVELNLDKTFLINDKQHTQDKVRTQAIDWTKSLISKGYDSTTNGNGEYCVFDSSKIKIIKIEEVEDDT